MKDSRILGYFIGYIAAAIFVLFSLYVCILGCAFNNTIFNSTTVASFSCVIIGILFIIIFTKSISRKKITLFDVIILIILDILVLLFFSSFQYLLDKYCYDIIKPDIIDHVTNYRTFISSSLASASEAVGGYYKLFFSILSISTLLLIIGRKRN